MYCDNCGEKLAPDTSVCPNCGHKLSKASNQKVHHTASKKTQTTSYTSGPQNKAPKKKGLPAILLIVFAVIAVLAVMLNLVSQQNNKVPEVNVGAYFKHRVEGINGQGFITSTIDEEGLLVEHGDDIVIRDKNDPDYKAKPKKVAKLLARDLEELTQVIPDPPMNLSNGDEVTINYLIDKRIIEDKYRVSLNLDPTVFTIRNLTEYVGEDPSKYFEIITEGISPNVSLSIDLKDGAPEYYSYVRPVADKYENLSSGEKVTITYEYPVEEFQAEGLVLEPTTQTITIDEVPEMITSFDSLDENAKDELKKLAEEAINDAAFSWTEADLIDKKYLGAITVSEKDPGYSLENEVILIYQIDAKEDIPEDDYKADFSFYTIVSIYDVIDYDGSIEYGDVETSNRSLEHIIKTENFNYISYKGYYFLDKLFATISNNYDKDDYNIDLVMDADVTDHRVMSEGVAGDYISDQDTMLRLTEDGKAYMLSDDEDAYEGTYTSTSNSVSITFIGSNHEGPYEGLITDSKKIRIPDMGYDGEVFQKINYSKN